MRKEGRKAIGLDLYPNLKIKKKNKNFEEKTTKAVRSQDPSIALYMKQKKKSRRVAALQNRLEETLKERERLQALERLEKTQHKKIINKKSKKKIKSAWNHEGEKSTEITQALYKKLEKQNLNQIKSEEVFDHKTILAEKLRVLQERVSHTQDLLKSEAAITIQRWYRNIIYKNKPQSFENSAKSSEKDQKDS